MSVLAGDVRDHHTDLPLKFTVQVKPLLSVNGVCARAGAGLLHL
jgi:hypothetical protein